MKIECVPLNGFSGLEPAWRALEAQAPAMSFFQSWTWVGCLAEERYPNPILLRATQGGRLLGLALFNRRGRHLHLAESGDAALDAPFIEHNAPLALQPKTAAALLRAAWTVGGAGRLTLSGVAPDLAAQAGGTMLRLQERLAPRLDLAAVRAGGGDWLASRSANTRQQVRRSIRAYGTPVLHRAADLPQALDWLRALIELHTASWQARGRPGAFATTFLQRFHQALIARALPRGELDLLRISAGEQEVGYLYNFRLRGHVSAYQSGLQPVGSDTHRKPGLTSHALAITQSLARGDAVYDFLGGDDRYKRSLSNAVEPLHWVQKVPRWSAWGIAARLRAALGRD